MTALEQMREEELQRANELNTNLIERLEKQEQSFISQLQQQQKLYENNISKIVGNYEINLSKITSIYEYNIIQNTKEMKSVQQKHENTVSDILKQINQILDLNITLGETGESYHEQLQNLKKQVWGLQQGQKELKTSLENIITKMFPSQA